jgi:zinc protease
MKVLTLLCVLFSAPVFAVSHIAEHLTRTQLAGIDVIAYPTAIDKVVTLAGALPGGDAFAGTGNIAVPTLTGMMLDRGTTTEDKYSIASKLDSVGASIGFEVDTQAVQISARCLSKDLPAVIGLLAEQLRSPAFSAEEFDKAKQQLTGSIQQASQNTEYRADELFSRAIYPEGHPNRKFSNDEYLAALKSVTLQDIKNFHRDHYGPAHMTLVLVGDIDVPQVRAEIERAFSGWSGGHEFLRGGRRAEPQAAATQVAKLEGKTSVSVILGAATGLQYRDSDALALRVGTAILGSGFTGRLMSQVRDKGGLTYGIGANLADDNFTDGSWRISASFAPQLLDQGLAATRRELQAWWLRGVTARELAARKQGLIGSFHVSLATTGGLARALLQAVQRGHEISWLDEYPEAIRAITLEQVNAAIKKHLDPARMALVEAGTVP